MLITITKIMKITALFPGKFMTLLSKSTKSVLFLKKNGPKIPSYIETFSIEGKPSYSEGLSRCIFCGILRISNISVKAN